MEGNEVGLAIITVLTKIRTRLLTIILLLFCGSVTGYFLADQVMRQIFGLVRQVIFISPTEAFVTKIKVSLGIGFILSLPFLLFIIINGLCGREGGLSFKVRVLFTFGSLLLFLLGGTFCYFAILPVAITFLLDFATLEMQPMLSAGRLVSFVLMSVLMFGITFELPVIIMLLAKLGLVDEQTLRQKRRYAILAIFITAGILTPSPDVLSQILMAIPLLGLYEAGILLTRFCKRRETDEVTIPAEQQQLFM